MAGLISNAMGQEGPGPDESKRHEGAESPQFERGEGSEEDGGFTAKQQKELDTFSLAAQKALFDGSGVAEQLAQALGGQNDVATALADFAYNITSMLDEKSNGMLEEELLAPAAYDVLSQVVEVAEAAGHKIVSRDLAKATQLMMARFFRENGATDEDVGQFMGAVDPGKVGDTIDQEPGLEPGAQPQGA